MQRTIVIITLVAIVSAALLPAFAAAEPKDQTTMPFKATATGHDTSETFAANGIHLTSVVHGNGIQLGAFTQTLDYVLSYDLVNFAGTATITAADGSQIFLTDAGTEPGFAAQIFPTPFSATFTITGGTGRFAGATGQGTIAGTDYGQGLFTFTVTGSISR